ncbi:MAG: CCA tRNA nucleotidyltransferase [Chloroflexi bacterium]|nr:CCA tRNA nucleotidyltransferase [Chloroflexota bacterium]
MSETINLARRLGSGLPPDLVGFLRTAGKSAGEAGQKLYLVGGVVRDLLLGRSNVDLDLVLEGDAIRLAQELASGLQGKMVAHRRFGTASVQWNGWKVDIATARLESYPHPGALPVVRPGSIETDLSRRDFTINAMAVELAPEHYGLLLDRFGGLNDLRNGLVRVLHELSFIDDATRIWRALRYEQRLGFGLEASTLALLKRDVNMLSTVSGDRIRHELELALKEPEPERVLCRAGELGVLARLHPSLKCDDWLVEKFGRSRETQGGTPGVYLALLCYRLGSEETEQLVSYLRPASPLARTLRDTANLKAKLELLTDPTLAPSAIRSLLDGYSLTALAAAQVATDSPLVRERVDLYLRKLRHVKPSLTGDDLKKLGVPPGPGMKEALQALLQARLDGRVTTRREEEDMVKRRTVSSIGTNCPERR